MEKTLIELTNAERDFIVDNALNGLWSHSMDKLKENLGDVERKNIEQCRDEAKRLMLKLDPNCFS